MKNLSDFWRTRRSYDKAVEMKTVLEDLKAFIEMAADEGEFNVRWGTASQNESAEKKVTLSYMPVADIPTPFSGKAIDVIAGFAAHEAGHRIRDQRGQSVRLLDDNERPTGMTSNVERAIRNILEDVYIDHYLYVSKAPVLETYIRRGRDWDKTQAKYAIDVDELKQKAQAEGLSKIDILRLWIKYELYAFNSAEELKDFPDSVLETLLNLAQITDTYCKKKGLVDAVSIYESIWDQFKGYSEPVIQPSGNGESGDDGNNGEDEDDQGTDFSSGSGSKKEDDDQESEDGKIEDSNSIGQEPEDQDSEDDEAEADNESGIGADRDEESDDADRDEESDDEEVDDEPSSGETDKLYDNLLSCQDEERNELPAELGQSVEAAIMNDREDISQDVIEEFSDEGFFDAMQDQYHSNIIVEKATTLILPNQDDEVSRSIRQIFNFRKRRKTRYSRGTEEGTISQTRLYRAGMGSSHLYEKRDIKDSLDINVCILCDMSSSVHASQKILGQCVSSLALGLSHRRGVKVCILAYNSPVLLFGADKNDVSIYRLFETGSKEVSFIEANGGTPSVAAMGAVPGLIRRLLGRASDNLLIHITDGFPHDESLLGTDIEDLIEVLAKKHKIDTYCLAVMGYGAGTAGLASNQDNLLKKAYGDSYEKLNSYTDLPEALRKLLYNLLVTT